MIHDRLLHISCSQGGSRAAAHLINVDLTGHTAAAARRLPAAPRGKEGGGRKKKNQTSSRVATPHQRHFRISYVINSDLSLQEHHAAHRTAGRRVLSCSPRPKNYLSPSRFLTAASLLGPLYNNCHPPLFNTDIDELMFNMADLSPIKPSAVIRRWPA